MIRIPGTILVSGNLVVDTVVFPADQIPAVGTQWVDSIGQYLGGNGANTSYAIGFLGGRARTIGWTGADAFGAYVRTQLQAAGVDVSFIRDAPGEGTSTSVALARTDGTRGFLHYIGASRAAFRDAFEEWPAAWIAGCSHYHLANPFALPNLRLQAPAVLRSSHSQGLTTSLDTAWDSQGEWMRIVEPCLPFVDILFANEDEIRMLTGHTDPRKAARVFKDAGAGSVVVKLGPRGSVSFDGGSEWETHATRVEAVDTTGAGDCFVGGYLAGLQKGLSAQESAVLANRVGGLSVSALGAVSGLVVKIW